MALPTKESIQHAASLQQFSNEILSAEAQKQMAPIIENFTKKAQGTGVTQKDIDEGIGKILKVALNDYDKADGHQDGLIATQYLKDKILKITDMASQFFPGAHLHNASRKELFAQIDAMARLSGSKDHVPVKTLQMVMEIQLEPKLDAVFNNVKSLEDRNEDGKLSLREMGISLNKMVSEVSAQFDASGVNHGLSNELRAPQIKSSKGIF